MEEKELVIHRICEECEASYNKELPYSLTKIDELNEKVSEGKYTFTETENQLIYRKTWFVCQDCEHSTKMNDTSGAAEYHNTPNRHPTGFNDLEDLIRSRRFSKPTNPKRKP